jgi:hypothetical protein
MSESEVNENLNKAFETTFESDLVELVEEPKGVGELVAVSKGDQLPVAATPNQDIEYDYERSRDTHHDLIETGTQALDDLLKIAKESQHPRAYEVAATMMKNLSDMTDKLMALHEKKKQIENGGNGKGGAGSSSPQSINVDKAVFVGSTTDLLKKIKQN